MDRRPPVEPPPSGPDGRESDDARPAEAEPGHPRADETASPPPTRSTDREAEERLRRAMADLDNLRKRFDREVARERAAERAMVAADWVPVVDNLERALQHAGGDVSPVVAGLRAVHDQALAVLTRLGYPRFDDVGEPFDPMRHEAVGALESDAPAGTVVEVVRPGYGTSEVILRPAAVLVARSSD